MPEIGQRIPNAEEIGRLVNATSPVVIEPDSAIKPPLVNVYHAVTLLGTPTEIPPGMTLIGVAAQPAQTPASRSLPCIELGGIVERAGCNCPRKDVRKCLAGRGNVRQGVECETCPPGPGGYQADN